MITVKNTIKNHNIEFKDIKLGEFFYVSLSLYVKTSDTICYKFSDGNILGSICSPLKGLLVSRVQNIKIDFE